MRKRHLFMILACLSSALSCKDSRSQEGLTLQPVVSTGRLEAEVVSQAGGEVPHAAVWIDGEQKATVDSAGKFSLELPTGRHQVKIVAEGYMEWLQDLPVVKRPWPWTMALAPLSEAEEVYPDQETMVQAGPATIAFPANSYPALIQVKTAFVEGTSDARPGTYMFTDEGGSARVALSVVHLSLPIEPMVPVTLSMPVPAGETGELVLFHISETGETTEPITPVRIEHGLATFQVPHFDNWLLTKRCTAHLAHINWLRGEVEFRVPPDEQWQIAKVGQGIGEGTIIRTRDGDVSLTYAYGERARLGENTTFTVTSSLVWLKTFIFSIESRITIWSTRVAKRMQNKRVSAPCAVRGSVIDFQSEPCGGGGDLQKIDYQVYEGEGICNPTPDADLVIPAGQAAVGCVTQQPGEPSTDQPDAGTSTGCSATLSCSTFCSRAQQKAEQDCQQQGGTVVSPFDAAGCLATCECLIGGCPELLPCALDISCPGCAAISCDELMFTCNWGGWLKCARKPS